LGPSAVAKVSLRKSRCNTIFEITVAIESKGVTRNKPNILTIGEDDPGTSPDGLEEESETKEDGTDVGWLPGKTLEVVLFEVES
jgi:activator of HSP90 ATPase